MITRLAVELEPVGVHPAGLRSANGRALRSQLLSALGRVHPDLSDALHSGRKAFRWPPVTVGELIKPSVEGPWTFPVGIADPDLLEPVLDAFGRGLETLNTELGLSARDWPVGKSMFRVADVVTQCRSWAQLADAPNPTAWRIETITPLVKRNAGGAVQPLEIPMLSLAGCAAEIDARLGLAAEQFRSLVGRAQVGDFQLRSQLSHGHRPDERGIVGWFTVGVSTPSSDVDRAMLATLMRFGSVMGIGDRRTVGWGRISTNPDPEPRASEHRKPRAPRRYGSPLGG